MKFWRLLCCFAAVIGGGAVGQATWPWLGIAVALAIVIGGVTFEQKVLRP